jgi:hypothetical protein
VKVNLSAGIKLNKQITVFLLIILFSLNFDSLFSQSYTIKPTRQSSFEAFSKGNYEQAFREFSELLLTYSKDPLYKYYSGVCLVNLGREPENAETLLQQALQGAAVVKTLPSDAIFYLGRAQQMSGKFTEALHSFNLYTEQAGKKAAREVGVPELIQQCKDEKGKISGPGIKPDEVGKNAAGKDNHLEDTVITRIISPVPGKKVTQVRNNLPPDYEKVLGEALNLQFKADSLSIIIAGQKKILETLPNTEKAVLKSGISENELLSASFQKSADQKYSDAQLILNPGKEIIKPKEKILQTDDKKILDSAKQSDIKTIKEPEKQADTIRKIMQIVNKPVESLALFEVLSKPVSDPKEKIIIDPEVPEGLIYRIQIAVFRNPVSPSYFNGITPVYGFKIPGTDKTNYYAGMFRLSSSATKALIAVKAKGFRDAFIVALSGNKTVSSDRALNLEKEWGKKPFISKVNTIPETPLDTVPPALLFRVEVIRSVKPIKDDLIDGIRKMAGNRGLDIQNLDDGNIVYLIGKFITFESAAEYADLMVRNGYREARVVAWLGKREIPVETARQLFDNME